MEEAKSSAHPKPGMDEALNPELGNGSTWTALSHDWLLRAVDPLKSLDNHFMDEVSSPLWSKEETLSPDVVKIVSPAMPDSEEREKPAANKSTEVHEKPDQEWLESIKAVPEPVQPPKIVEKPELEGKRIKKVARKAEEEKVRTRKSPPKPRDDQNLSPFTNWLKGLSGSEYVHPYEDDFAFRQGESLTSGEGISETYADLLAAQGYKDQAIEMYRKLIEKFPEKSRFFAAKIEALL